MKTGKLLVPVIYGILHCVLSATTLTRLSQYEIAVEIGGYSNPNQVRPVWLSCNGSSSSKQCCDDFNTGTFQCNRCDSFFTYCLRNVDALTAGCPEGGNNIMRSDVNLNDATIDFSQNTVLGLDNPLVFQGLNHTWNGVQLYIEIKDQDQDGSQLIDIVRWNITQPVGVPSGVINLTGPCEILTMEVNITVLCVPGFTGMMCDENIDDCVGVSCGKNRLCVDGINSFTCNCAFGFTGALCNETDECVNVTCSGRGQCVDGVASYMCNCDAGHTGVNCETNMDDCLSDPCVEGSQCVDGVDSFICVCHPGFTGELCQIDIDDCTEVSCSGNGQCVGGVDSFICMCNPGFTGELCQINIDDCVGVNCSGNGECVDKVNAFTCECSPGYKGPLCTEVSELRHSISVIPIVCGAVGALILILILTLLVIITLKCAPKHCSERVSKSAISETPKEPFEMKENEVYGVSIAVPQPERPPQDSVLMNTNICYATMQDLKS